MKAAQDLPIATGKRRKLLGLLAGALVGWAFITLRVLGWPMLALVGDPSFAETARQLPAALFLMMMFGIPLAVVAGFFVGWPTWAIGDRFGATRAWHGMILGAATGAMIVAGFTVLELVNGILNVLNGGGSSYGDGGGTISINGMPTAHGWRLRVLDLLYYAFAGAIAGLVAWKVAGPAKRRIEE